MKKNKNLISSLMFLAFTVLLLLTSTFAWISISTTPTASDILLVSGKFDVEINLSVNKNNQGYILITTEEQLSELLDLSVPGNTYQFKLDIVNRSSSSLSLDVVANGVVRENEYEGFDLFDVYNIVDGEIMIDNSSTVIQTIDETSNYHLSNIVSNSSFIITKGSILEVNSTKSIEFQLNFDEETSDTRYQGVLSIGKINIYMNEGE